MDSHTVTLEGAEVQIGSEDRFWNCNVEVVVENERGLMGRIVGKEISGTVLFTHAVPKSLFVDAEDIPEPVDVVAVEENTTVDLESVFVTNGAEDKTIEFVARDWEMVVTDEKEPTLKERTVRFLDDLACDVVDDEVEVHSISVSRDPKKKRYAPGWDVGPTTLELVYDGE